METHGDLITNPNSGGKCKISLASLTTGCPADIQACRRKWPDMVSVSLTLVESATRPKLATPRPTSNFQGILSIREELGISLIGMRCIPIPRLRILQRSGR
jgi:hypothetical protein